MKGYILVRTDGAHIKDGKVRCSRHAANLALYSFIDLHLWNELQKHGYSEDHAWAVSSVHKWVKQGSNLDKANDKLARYNGPDAKYDPVSSKDLQTVREVQVGLISQWKIIEVEVI